MKLMILKKMVILFLRCSITITEIEDEVEYIGNENEIVITETNKQWYIEVPVSTEDGTVIHVKLFADTGANAACVNTKWALKHFRNFIRVNKRRSFIGTAAGEVRPKFVLWLAFPTKDGKIIRARMYLMDDLPVDILADLNMLEAFGYKFKNKYKPSLFYEHKSQEEVDLGLDNEEKDWTQVNMLQLLKDDITEDDPRSHWFGAYVKRKDKFLLNGDDEDYKSNPSMYHTIISDNKEVLSIKKLQLDSSLDRYNYGILKSDPKTESSYLKSICPWSPYKLYSEVYQGILDKRKYGINADPVPLITDAGHISEIVNCKQDSEEKRSNESGTESELLHKTESNEDSAIRSIVNIIKHRIVNTKSHYKYCLFIRARESFLATKDEIRDAAKLKQNLKLKWNDLSYLRDYQYKYGRRYEGLYDQVMAIVGGHKPY